MIPNIKQIVNSRNFSAAQTDILWSDFKWPNDVQVIPPDVFGPGFNAIVIPDGFLPPGKTEGNIYMMIMSYIDPTKMQQVVQISPSKSGFFYHMGKWIDMDGDGRKDYLTARTNAQAGSGELVWYKHPEFFYGSGNLWEEHIVTKGPDVMFDVQTIQGYEGIIVFASEFFNKRLTIYQVVNGKVGLSRIIDSTIDQAYSVRYLDINDDGNFELLVNNHETNNTKAGIFLYNVPQDLFHGEFTRKQIASGFTNAFSYLIPNMCPGFPYAVYPGPGHAKHILVAGDGDYSAHLMRPDGKDAFQREVIKNLGGTVGAITTYDFDGDGYLEFFVPNYDKNYIEVYQFYEGPNMVAPEDESIFLQ